jgi:ABC-type dipeptide/oligopeptide/nickel transport system ATPase subunit
MASISLKKLNKTFGALKVVHDIDLEIADKEFIILVGPSGCGKSTTLRMIAGLEEISGGELRIGQDMMNDVPSKDRDIAMVFQNYALYPHMTVYKNMAFGLQLRKAPREFIDEKVKEAANILDITHLLNRYGSMVGDVLPLIRDDPTLGVPLAHADDYLRAEVVFGATHEGALHLDDLLCRRTRISIETFDRGTDSAEEVADLVAPLLGWSREQREREVAHYLARVAAERESQTMPDDETADAARMGASDVVPVTTG